MDSDIDADTPVRIKPLRRIIDNDKKSPTLPTYSATLTQSNKTASPLSTYSTKSTKDQLDVSEIRRVLRKLRIELDIERKKSQELDYNGKHLEEENVKLERKLKDSISKYNSYKKKCEESIQNIENDKNNEISELQKKVEEVSNLVTVKNNGINFSNLLHITTRMDHICNNEREHSKDWDDVKNLVQHLKHTLKNPTENENVDEKLLKMKNHNAELKKIIRLLDIKLNKAIMENEILNKKLEIQSEYKISQNEDEQCHVEGAIKLEDNLHLANVEIIKLQKQITWLKNTENVNPASKERVEILSNLINSFKDSESYLKQELFVLQEKCNNFETVTNELFTVKNENHKLLIKLREVQTLQKKVDILSNSLSLAQATDHEKLSQIEKLELSNNQYKDQFLSMERLLKYIRETNEKRKELELEYTAMKTLLETKLQQKFMKQKDQNQFDLEDNSDDSTENLKIKLREMEKRRTQQAINYEEALLELEALNKTNQRQNIDLYRRNGVKDDVNNSTATNVMEGLLGNMEIGKIDMREGSIFVRPEDSSAVLQDDLKYLIDIKNGMASNFNLVKDFQEVLDLKNDKQRKHIAAPIQIRVENHPNQSSSKVIRWKSPDIIMNTENCQITSYHIYLDGDFYKAIGANESTSTVLPNLDSKTHRVSIRSVCPNGQSKDAQCTIEINSNTPAPTVLKANKITGTSAHVSWMPSNSTLRHIVWVNGVKYCDCLPGIYKILLQGLTADSLQKVRVHPVLDQYPDSTTISAYLDFQTLPIISESKINTSKKQIESVIEEIEPPADVKLKLGNRSGRFLVRWTCSSEPSSSSIKLVGYSILINNQCIALVNGAKNDRFSLNLIDLREITLPINQKLLNFNEQSYLALTVRTLGTIAAIDSTDCTVQSKDSQPPLKFSGQVAARIAGTAAEAAMMLGDQLAFFLNLTEGKRETDFDCRGFGKIAQSCQGDMTNAKSCWHSCYCLNNTDYYEEDDSFLPRSKFDWIENKTIPHRSISIHYLDQPQFAISSRSISDDSALDKLTGGSREIRSQKTTDFFEDSCSSASSNNSDHYSHTVSVKNYKPRRRSMTDKSNRDLENSSKYLAVRHTPKNSRTSKISPKDHSLAKISVPKIQITKDSSFSEDDENCQVTQHKSKGRTMADPYNDQFQYRSGSNQYTDFNNRPNQPSMDPSNNIQSKVFQSSPNERVPMNQRSNNYNNSMINGNAPPDRHYYGNQSSNDAIRFFVALYDYDPGTMSPNPDAIHEELPFKVGQTVKIFGQVDEDGFFTGETNGRRGLVPSNMVKEIDNSSNKSKFKLADNQNDQFMDRVLKKNKETPISRNVHPRQNMHQYNSDSHIEYPSNQYIGNQGHYDPGPISHRKSTDSGVSYVAPDSNSYQKANNVPRQSTTGPTGISLNGRKMIALYDYDPQVLSPNVDSDAELAFKANDIIMIISEIDEDGFYLGECNGQRGLVPSNFLIEASSTSASISSNRLRNHQSLDGTQNQNQYKERNISASSNFSDPPPAKDNRYKSKVMEIEREIPKNVLLINDDYTSDRNLEIENQKNINNISYEDSFDSGPSIIRQCAPKSELKNIPYQTNIERRGSVNNGVHVAANDHQYPRTVPPNNQIQPRITKPNDDRRISHEKPNTSAHSSIKLPLRRQSPPPPLEQDDMPIVMDLAPSKDNQKKKKLSSAPDNYRTNLAEPHDNDGHSDNHYANSNSSMSDNLERKRSVFKNPFKKKKS